MFGKKQEIGITIWDKQGNLTKNGKKSITFTIDGLKKMTRYKLKEIFNPKAKSRISGNGGFPVPNKKFIGKEFIITRKCLTWTGVLGYFVNDAKKETYAIFLDELEMF